MTDPENRVDQISIPLSRDLRRQRRARQSGVTMIEVLVAIVVLSVGLLGMAAMQGVSVQTNQSAYFRSQATLMTAEIFDAMRANRAAADDYEIDFDAMPADDGTIAGGDLNVWTTRMAQRLPNGTGRVVVTGPIGGTIEVTVSVRWGDERWTGGALTNSVLQMQTRM